MSEDRYIALLSKKLSGTISDLEIQELSCVQGQSAQNADLDSDIVKVWNISQDYKQNVTVDTDAAWNKFKTSIQEDHSSSTIPTKIVPLRVRRLRIWQIAAAVALLIATSTIWFSLNNSIPPTIVSTTSEKQEVILPDGSIVSLNINSRLEFPGEFRSERVVKLEGEAFFDVQKNPEKVFRVQTSNAIVEVLGTAFNVNAYRQSETIEIQVKEGKVAFISPAKREKIILKASQKGTLNKENRALKKENTNHNAAWAWKTGFIHFRNTPLQEVIETLSDHYGVKINLSKSAIKDCPYTATRFEFKTIDSALTAISTTLSMTIEKQNGVYFLKNGQCN